MLFHTQDSQHKRRLYTRASPDGQHWNQINYIFCSQRWKTLYSPQKQDWELTVAQITSSLLPNSDKLKKVGKTTRPFRYDLNQIPYDYTVEVRNRFKGLELIESWRTMDRGLWHCIGGSDQDHSSEKAMQKGKTVVWGGLTNSCEKKRSEKQRRKGKI